MKIIAAAAICAHLWRSDALPSDSEPSNLRGDKARELVQACATTPRYYPDTSGGWDGGYCKYSLNCNIPGYETGKDCCENVYPDQSTFFCTCKRTDLDTDMQAACAATLGLDTPAEEGTPDAAPAPAPDAENSSDESVSSNSDYNTGYNKWSPVLLGPGLPADLLDQCFAYSSMPNAHPCNALETVAALHHDSHGDTDLVKSAFDEFLTKPHAKEAGEPCQPDVDVTGILFECPSDHFCLPDDDTWNSGLCEACPENFDDDCADFELERGGDGVCHDKCSRAPRGQCYNPLQVNGPLLGGPKTCSLGTFCSTTESELFEYFTGTGSSSSESRDCTVCPSGSTKEEVEAACRDLFADFTDDGAIEFNAKNSCLANCAPTFIAETKVKTITVLANRQSGDGYPGNDMMLLGYNMDTKKVTHNNDGPFISIDEMDGEFGVDDLGLVEDSRFTSPYTANPNWQGGEEVQFSDNMIMYCCFNEQFQGDFA